jgi:Transcription factor WhiB
MCVTATATPGTTARRAYRSAASERLVRALVDIASQGLRTHCSDAGAELWLSDSEADRAEAARLCIGCPVLAECGAAAAAHGEKFGVWGGVDRSPRGIPGPRPKATAA